MQFRRQALFTIVCIIITGCSVKKNTWTSRNYHTLTSYYNVYHNGNQAFLEGQKNMRDASKNDYTTLLPIYYESDKELAKKADSEMDRAIEKSKKLINKHSITAKPKRQSGNTSERYKSFMNKNEYNPMVDDAWLLMGKAQVVKHENQEAISTLEYINREYEGSEARYDALIWLSKAYINLEQYTNAQAAMESYDLDGMAPETLYANYMAAYTNLLMTQGKYAEALPYLEKAAKNTKKRHFRFRYQYILAQLYQMLEKKDDAATSYRLVAKNNPDYEMAFNARINMASVVKGSTGAAETEKTLNKLIRDKKNKEYLDQIYYALGNLKSNMGEKKQAISNYRLSIEKSSGNDRQKGLSFLALGDIFYKKPQYIEAFEAYDSAVVFLNTRHPGFDQVSERHNHLQKLSGHLKAIRQQDSLLLLAQLPEAERMARINQMLDKQKQELDKKQQATQSAFSDPFFRNDGNSKNQAMAAQGSKWYFYNVSATGAGKLEFERRWGKRKNEDNWRRSVKTSLPPEDTYQEPGMPYEEPGMNQKDTLQSRQDGNTVKEPTQQSTAVATKESLLADIPLTEQAKQKSHKTIEESLFESGNLLNNLVQDYRSAAQCYERLLKEYPQTLNRHNSLVGLYQAYEKLEDKMQMARLKELITKENPGSKFARYLNDPLFFEKLEAQRVAVEKHYEATYTHYLMNDFTQAIAQAMPYPEENPYIAKYCLIKALSYAKLGDSEPFNQTLKTIVADYPGTEEAKFAAQLISEVEKGRQPIKATPYRSMMTEKSQTASAPELVATQQVPFLYSPYEGHCAIIIGDSATNMAQLQYNMADYNFGRFLLADYEIEQQQLPDQTKLLLVKGLKNKIEALDYLYTIREQSKLFSGAGLSNPEIVVVSDNNIKNLVLSGNLAAYLKFFKEHYLTAIQEPAKPEKTKELPAQKPKPAEVTEVAAQPEPVETKPIKTEEPQNEAVAVQLPTPEEKPIFINDDGSSYAALILIKKGRIDLRKIQTIITNFTINNYGEELHGETTDLGTTHRVIKVTGFKTKQAAKDYITSITSNSFLMNNFPGSDHHFIFINETNYQLLLENKEIKGYKSFIDQQK
ncbi:MAG: tetratricopeptide repeat protein [Breznakibacter sp.]|nr:tetratricopeptide repeat protein [Breznakibacter sp.]